MQKNKIPLIARLAIMFALTAAFGLLEGCGDTDVNASVVATFQLAGLPAEETVSINLNQGDVMVAHSAVAGDDGQVSILFANWDGDRPDVPADFKADVGFSDGTWALHVTVNVPGLVSNAPATIEVKQDATNEFNISFAADPAVTAAEGTAAAAEAAAAEAEVIIGTPPVTDDLSTPDVDESAPGTGLTGELADTTAERDAETARADAATANAAACTAAVPTATDCSSAIATLQADVADQAARCEAVAADGTPVDCDERLASATTALADAATACTNAVPTAVDCASAIEALVQAVADATEAVGHPANPETGEPATGVYLERDQALADAATAEAAQAQAEADAQAAEAALEEQGSAWACIGLNWVGDPPTGVEVTVNGHTGGAPRSWMDDPLCVNGSVWGPFPIGATPVAVIWVGSQVAVNGTRILAPLEAGVTVTTVGGLSPPATP